MDHIGIDVHKRERQICLLTEGGELIERRIRTEPERFAAVLGGRPRARIVIERRPTVNGSRGVSSRWDTTSWSPTRTSPHVRNAHTQGED